MDMFKFRGAWIFPDASIHVTDNILSHAKVIDEFNLHDTLVIARDNLQWDSAEEKTKYYNDLAYVAMKSGYARVSTFYNLAGIELHSDLSELQLLAIREVLDDLQSDLLKNAGIPFSCIALDYFCKNESLMFNTIGEAISHLLRYID